MYTKPAFVIGNGRSRLAVNLEDLKKHGRIYGCNALYRDFTPHVLVATDPGITDEIENSGYPINHVFYTRRPNKELGSQLITEHFGFSSGPIAGKLAASAGHTVIYLVGIDLASTDTFQNNVYAGTANYRAASDQATYYGNWIKQFLHVFREHPHQRFVRLCNADSIIPYEWQTQPNYRSQLLEDFMADINNKPWQRSKE